MILQPKRNPAVRCSALLDGQPLTLMSGDCREVMKSLPDASVNCCVTSPPYWGLRNYGHPDQIGQEATPGEYVGALVQVFAEVRRLLQNDGTLWLVIGDSYSGSGKGGNPGSSPHVKQRTNAGSLTVRGVKRDGAKPKDMIGIPWRVALAMQADGWYLRADIIWAKPNPMPESVRDRPTRAHEYVFLMSKAKSYHYDASAVAEPCQPEAWHNSDFRRERNREIHPTTGNGERNARGATRNKRDVWTVPTMPYKDAHFATFPPDLIKPCILAGCPAGGLVLDPFAGAGTTGKVALELGRRSVLIELNEAYLKLSDERCCTTRGLGLAV